MASARSVKTHEAKLPLVAVVGPTASGKSSLAVWLAEQLGGEVIASDSTQLYRGFDIGTAKPDAAERRGVPHHLLDVLDAHEIATAGAYRKMTIGVLENLERRGRLPIFTVGTGLYLRALLEGLACGLPVVGTPYGGTPELLAPLGGELVLPDGDPNALAMRVIELAREPARLTEIGSRARAYALGFSWDTVAGRLENVLGGVSTARG